MATVNMRDVKERMKLDLTKRLGNRRPRNLLELAQEASAIFSQDAKKYGGMDVIIDLVEDVVQEVWSEMNRADRLVRNTK